MAPPKGTRNAAKANPLVWASMRITPAQLIWLRKMQKPAQTIRDMLDFVRENWERFEAWRKGRE